MVASTFSLIFGLFFFILEVFNILNKKIPGVEDMKNEDLANDYSNRVANYKTILKHLGKILLFPSIFYNMAINYLFYSAFHNAAVAKPSTDLINTWF